MFFEPVQKENITIFFLNCFHHIVLGIAHCMVYTENLASTSWKMIIFSQHPQKANNKKYLQIRPSGKQVSSKRPFEHDNKKTMQNPWVF